MPELEARVPGADRLLVIWRTVRAPGELDLQIWHAQAEGRSFDRQDDECEQAIRARVNEALVRAGSDGLVRVLADVGRVA